MFRCMHLFIKKEQVAWGKVDVQGNEGDETKTY